MNEESEGEREGEKLRSIRGSWKEEKQEQEARRWCDSGRKTLIGVGQTERERERGTTADIMVISLAFFPSERRRGEQVDSCRVKAIWEKLGHLFLFRQTTTDSGG